MLAVVRYWLEQGVDGLRLDLFNAIYKDASFANNPWSPRPFPTEDNPHGFFQRNKHTIDHADTLAFARELRAVVDASPLPPRFLVGEVFGSVEDVRRYCHGEGQGPGLHLVFLFKTMSTAFTAPALRALVEEVERVFRAPLVPTWVFSNHDRPRSLLRLGGDVRKAKLLAMFQLTARGVPFIYYGEELGMAHGNIPLAAAKDPIAHKFRHIPGWLARGLRRRGILLNRDECRLPMAWTSAVHGGFSPETSPPWLTQRGPAAGVNVEAEDARPDSLLWVYRTLLALRSRRVSLHAGTLALDPAHTHSKHVLAYRRVADGATSHVFLNMSGKLRAVALPKSPLRVYSTLRGWRDDPTDGVLLPFEGVIAFAP